MAGGSEQANQRFRWLTNAIGSLALTSSRYAKSTILIVLVLTAYFAVGTTLLTTNVDVADVLPRGNGNTTAAKELTADFKSAFTMQVTLQFHIDDTGQQWAKDNREKLRFRQTEERPNNITDEVYIRAMAQAVAFMKAEDELICCSIGINDLFKLINWTVAGGEGAPDSSWGIPGKDLAGSLRYRVVEEAAETAILDALDALASPTWRTSAQLLMPSAHEEASTAEIGRRAIEARDRYIEWAEQNPDVAYQVFTGDNFPRLTVELPVANAHSSELTKEDFSRLLPIIAAFIIVALFLAFRSVGAVVISFSSLAIGTLWTYGAEGYLGIALNPLNLTLMPLIMGVGIDYSIHVVNEFLEHKSHGLPDDQAFREVGRRAGLALFIATLITVLGLLVMIASPSLLIAQFGALAAISIATIFVLSLTFIPAALTLWPRTDKMGQSFKPSTLVPLIGRLVSKGRVVILPAVLVLAVLGTVSSLDIKNEAFGDPGRNYLRDDPVRIEHETGLRWFYDVAVPDVKANVITFQGDMTDPQLHDYMRIIERELMKQPLVISDTLRTIPFLMETWLTVKDGGPGAIQYLAQGSAGSPPYPTSQEEIRAEFDALYASPVAELGSIFTNGPEGGYSLGVMTFSVRAATFEEAEQVWHQVWGAVNNASGARPNDVKVSFVGNTATNYLFVEEEVPWVYYMMYGASAILVLVTALFFRSWRAVAAVSVASFATSAWWLGLLPAIDVGMAITLVIPIIFIIALGSDYAIHLVWSIIQVGNTREVFRTTGKAIFFSWLTTAGPFVIFVGIQDLSVRKTMIATVLAVTIIFVVTMLTIPAFYKVGGRPKLELPAKVQPAAGPPPESSSAQSTYVAVRRRKG